MAVNKQTPVDLRDYAYYLEGIKEECEAAYRLMFYKNTFTPEDKKVIIKALKRAKDIRVW